MIEKATHVTIFWNLARNPEKNSSKIRRKNAKFEFFAIELMKFINSIAKKKMAIFDEKMRISSARSQDLSKILRLRRIPAKSSALHVTYLYDIMDGVSIVIFITQKMLMTKRTALKIKMLFRKISGVNRCRQNVLK